MKRLSLSVFLIFCLQNFVHGQSADSSPRWHFGVMGGLHLITYSPNDSYKAIKSPMAGLDIGYDFQNSPRGWSLRLQPNFTAIRNTSKSGTYGTGYYMEFKWRTQYIELPMLVRYTITDGKIRPFAEIGASWNVWRHSSVGGSGLDCRDGGCYPFEIKRTDANFEGNRFKALAGAGVQIDVGKVTIPITVRVLDNLKKRESILDPGTGSEYKLPKARMVQVTTGVAF